jgi:hypothetical protein
VFARRNLGRAARRALIFGFALVAGACSGSGSEAVTSTTAPRPTTSATLQIVSPSPNAVTGHDVKLELRLAGAALVPATQVGGKIRPDRGHIHVSVDGALIAMPAVLEQPIPGLARGLHTVQAEFVAADHLPFKNRVVAAVTFRVG